jgi:glycerate 2-kinase
LLLHQFNDKRGSELPLGGQALADLHSCDLSHLLSTELLKVAVDVKNPLLGGNGAAHVFAPQKGADESAVEQLETGLTLLADLLERTTGKQMRNVEGTGAAGGTAFGLSICLDAPLISGFHWLSQLLDLQAKIAWADLIITAEGKLDAQSLSGKATGELSLLAKKFSKELIVVAASVDETCNWQSKGIKVLDLHGELMQVGSSDIRKSISQFIQTI